jgi:hypothetical protein
MPIIQSVIAGILGDLTARSLKLVLSLGANEDDSSALPWTVAVEDFAGNIVGILSGDQAENVAEFLATAEVGKLCQAHFLCRLGAKDKYSTKKIQTDIGIAFAKLATNWCSNPDTDWSSLAEDIWRQIDAYMNQVLPAEEVLSHLSPFELNNLRDKIEGAWTTERSKGVGVPKFLRELVNISLDLRRIEAIGNNVSDIKRHFADYYKQIRLDHAQHDYRIPIDELYIDRDLMDWESRSRIASSSILSDSYLPRIVVTGDPGVGKSTFTEYLIWLLTREKIARDSAPLIFNCREYAVAHEASILAFLRDKIANTLNLRYTEQDIEEVLILGRGFLIIDGVDEILDLGRRRDLIRKIEVFAKRFPLCPIIATTRNIGYAQARFDNLRFRRYELQPFTEEQIEEYIRRWFFITARDEVEVGRFFMELASIPDLRSNPLMLSLLCVLYRARGHIPRNRRQIYSQCADLLFNRWDRMRHIEQPYDHLHYGDELMQEIATWFYRSQSAQAGLEEQQIKKVIALFLTDTAAVSRVAAEQRASAFLDFCADRAWLLGSAGTNERGQRLFIFTHRTFMEFFAAESIARSYDIEKIALEVAVNYDKDASSVLPDLLVQSAEVHRKGGARDIIIRLMDLGRSRDNKNPDKYLPLCLRIVNLSPVNPRLMEDIFERTCALWEKRSPADTRLSTVAVLEMYRDPRYRFMEYLKATSECLRAKKCEAHDTHPMVLFILRWANLYHRAATLAYQDEWGEFVAAATRDALPYLATIKDPALNHFLVSEGYIEANINRLTPRCLVTVALGEPAPGYGLQSLYRTVCGGPERQDLAILEKICQYAHVGKKLQFSFFEALSDACSLESQFSSRTWSKDWLSESEAQMVEEVALWIGCAILEATNLRSFFHDSSESFLEISFDSLANTRQAYHDGWPNTRSQHIVARDILTEEELQNITAGRPAWLLKWCYYRRNLT